jgi:hypothetical protein
MERKTGCEPATILGKVMVFVLIGLTSPLKCASVHPVSRSSITSAPVVERSTTGIEAMK